MMSIHCDLLVGINICIKERPMHSKLFFLHAEEPDTFVFDDSCEQQEVDAFLEVRF